MLRGLWPIALMLLMSSASFDAAGRSGSNEEAVKRPASQQVLMIQQAIHKGMRYLMS